MSFTVEVKRRKVVDLAKVQTSLRGPKKVAVGFPAGKSDGSAIMKAIYNEFGTRGSGKGFGTERGGGFGGPIPERPFLRSAMRDNKGKYRIAMRDAAKHLLYGGTSLSTVLSKLGIMAQGDVVQSIVTWTSPPNSPVTIAIKGSSKPLTDTGNMQQSVQYEVRT